MEKDADSDIYLYTEGTMPGPGEQTTGESFYLYGTCEPLQIIERCSQYSIVVNHTVKIITQSLISKSPRDVCTVLS